MPCSRWARRELVCNPFCFFENMLERHSSRANQAAGRDGRGLNAQRPFALATRICMQAKVATPTHFTRYKSPRARCKRSIQATPITPA
jgi:hypothetical protein